MITGSYKRDYGRIDYLESGGIKSRDRTHYEAGFRQAIEHRCFNAGDEFIVRGAFKLQNSTGHGASCNPHATQKWREKTNCPSIHLKAWGCAVTEGLCDDGKDSCFMDMRTTKFKE